jgi:hypothetical protein
MLPPVLEIYVVFHPEDRLGARIGQVLLEHFRGTTYSGLIGGAVDVYVRSESAVLPGGPPRPIPAISPLPYGLPSPALTAIVLAAGGELASTVASDSRWRSYVAEMVAARSARPSVLGLFPVSLTPHALSGTVLETLVGGVQQVAPGAFGTPDFVDCLTRDVAQGVAQLADPQGGRLRVFISHTKRASMTEEAAVTALVSLVRRVIGATRLDDFFDANDIQPNEDWTPVLEEGAASGALLAVRTDLYSSRQWCQREVLIAKRFGMPVVILDALTDGEERGSFLMDHVPRMPCRWVDGVWLEADVRHALGQLVDECLKRALWRRQQQLAETEGALEVDWWAPHAPEPTTFLDWLGSHPDIRSYGNRTIIVLHPDPPLGVDEINVLRQQARIAGVSGDIVFLTPRGLAARGD